jgi:hypothetical protein
MKKKQNNSIHASALQIGLALALLSISAILMASSFTQQSRVSRPAQGKTQPAFQTINTYTGMPAGLGPVTVTATCGVIGPTNYPTLKDAFDAINAGTHQCDIIIDIVSGTIEGSTPATLNGSGAGPASYTSILIRPVNDGVSIGGNPAQGFGVVQLNGASNVTIDGDNPNSLGINRDLTIQNSAPNTQTFGSVVRIALATAVTNHADSCTIKNLDIIGSSPGRNISTPTSTSGSENTTFGLFAGPGASSTDPTLPPVAITSVSTGVGAGATASNLLISNNNFSPSMARAVSINSSATSVFPGLQIRQNEIGNPQAGSVDQVKRLASACRVPPMPLCLVTRCMLKDTCPRPAPHTASTSV